MIFKGLTLFANFTSPCILLNKLAWSDKLKRCLLQWDFDNTKADTSLLIKKKRKTFMIMVLIYVDDMLIIGPNNVDLKKII